MNINWFKDRVSENLTSLSVCFFVAMDNIYSVNLHRLSSTSE